MERSVAVVSKLPWGRFVWKPKAAAEIRRDTLDLVEPSGIIPKLRVSTLVLYAQHDFRVNTSANTPLMQQLLERAPTRDATVIVWPHADHDFFEAREPTIRDVANTTGYASGYLQTILSWILRRVTVQP
jgi:dienelactone hydrolase